MSPAFGPESPTRFGGATPVALFLREHAQAWQAIRLTRMRDEDRPPIDRTFSAGAHRMLDALRNHGASFLRELAAAFTGSGDDQLDLDAALRGNRRSAPRKFARRQCVARLVGELAREVAALTEDPSARHREPSSRGTPAPIPNLDRRRRCYPES